jgi:lysophospholipase L1-like esterase
MSGSGHRSRGALIPGHLPALAMAAVFLSVASAPGPCADQPAEASRPLLRIVALGDSTTATAHDWAPEIRQVYAECLPAALAARGLQAEVINAGIGDTTTRDAVRRLDRDVRSHHPSWVVVQFGINDSWIDADQGRLQPRLTRSEYRRNLRSIVRVLQGDGARVVLMTPNPMRWSDRYYLEVFQRHPGLLDTRNPRGIDRLLDAYAQDVRETARAAGVPLVDVHAEFENFGRVPGQSVNELLLSDGIHPNQSGQDLVCRLLTDELVRLLAPG